MEVMKGRGTKARSALNAAGPQGERNGASSDATETFAGPGTGTTHGPGPPTESAPRLRRS